MKETSTNAEVEEHILYHASRYKKKYKNLLSTLQSYDIKKL